MDAIPDILDDLRAGRMIVLVDDENRENEGDLVCCAESVTPETINFMLREARGMLCVALTGEHCDRLELSPQAPVNTASRSTAFTVSVDAHERFGVTTGVSAADRATTIRVMSDPATRPADLLRPGHVHPLRARDGGVLVRAGQTEGSVDLCRLAGLKPASVIIEIMNDDGTMARLPDLEKLCQRFNLRMCSVADIIQYRLGRENLVERLEHAPFQSEFGEFQLFVYRSLVDPLLHIALTVGDVGRLDDMGNPVELTEPVLVRMHSQNVLGDLFGDVQQPSGPTLRSALRMIQREGRGALVYLRHEMAGSGLLQRLQTLQPLAGRFEADDEAIKIGRNQPTPGVMPPFNKGAYGVGCQILRDLGARKLKLITKHPFHPHALNAFGLEIEAFVPPDDGA